MTAIATEEARRLLRIARADYAACAALRGVVEDVLAWAEAIIAVMPGSE